MLTILILAYFCYLSYFVYRLKNEVNTLRVIVGNSLLVGHSIVIAYLIGIFSDTIKYILLSLCVVILLIYWVYAFISKKK